MANIRLAKIRLPKYSKTGFSVTAIILAVVLLMSSFQAINKYDEIKEKHGIKKRLEELVKKDPYYIDESRVLGASAGNRVFAVFKTGEEDYVLSPLINAKIADNKFIGAVTIRYPNGELFSGEIETFISGYTLRDGTKVDAQVVQKAMTFLELGDKSLVPIEIFNGDVEGGVLTDVFSARAVTTGFQLAGYIEDGVVKEGYLVADPTYVSSSTRAFGYLVLLKERPEMDDQKVLPAYTENMDAGSQENAENGVWYGGGNTEPSEGAGGTYIPEQSELDGNNSIEISINEKQLMEYEGNLVMPDYDRGTYRIRT